MPGKFKKVVGPESCHTCDIGKYSETRGATDSFTCIDCPKGKYLPRNFPKYVRAAANARWNLSVCDALVRARKWSSLVVSP